MVGFVDSRWDRLLIVDHGQGRTVLADEDTAGTVRAQDNRVEWMPAAELAETVDQPCLLAENVGVPVRRAIAHNIRR